MSGPVVLPPAAFWQLLAKVRQVELLRAEAQRLTAELAREAADGRALFATLGKEHGFDPDAVYRWDETTCTLVPVPGERRV